MKEMGRRGQEEGKLLVLTTLVANGKRGQKHYKAKKEGKQM